MGTSLSPEDDAPGPASGTQPTSAERVRLTLDPYQAPKSHHASRAFAELQARGVVRKKRRKFALILGMIVVGGTLFAVWSATHWLR